MEIEDAALLILDRDTSSLHVIMQEFGRRGAGQYSRKDAIGCTSLSASLPHTLLPCHDFVKQPAAFASELERLRKLASAILVEVDDQWNTQAKRHITWQDNMTR